MKKFENPEILVREFEVEDVGTTSSTGTEDYVPDGDELPFVPANAKIELSELVGNK